MRPLSRDDFDIIFSVPKFVFIRFRSRFYTNALLPPAKADSVVFPSNSTIPVGFNLVLVFTVTLRQGSCLDRYRSA